MSNIYANKLIKGRKEEVTHTRINHEDKTYFEMIKLPSDTMREFFHKLAEDISGSGAIKKISGSIIELQILSTHFIHEDFYHCFEMLKGLMSKALKNKNIEDRKDMCNKLNEAIENILRYEYG